MIRICSFICFVIYSGICFAKQVSLYDEIGFQTGIKPSVLYAMSLHESSPHNYDRPWPWAVNIAGKSYWFNTKKEAVNAVLLAQNAGIKNIDVGLMQISLKWHGHKFSSLNEAFDPKTNLTIAAKIMQQLLKKNSLFDAIGKYHCPGKANWCQKAANNYAVRVVGRLRGIM